MKTKHQATGHHDRDGQMIHRHDTVRVYRHRAGDSGGAAPHRAHVLWVDHTWLLYFGPGDADKLNNYTARELQRVTEKAPDFMGQYMGQ